MLTVIGSLAEPPADAYDGYLRLHLLSHRLIRPHEADLSGLFGVLANVAWTSYGPVDPPSWPKCGCGPARAAGRSPSRRSTSSRA